MIVLDASAAVLALLNDGDAQRSLASETVAVPHLADSEVAHALRAQVLRGHVSADDAGAALAGWARLGLRRFGVVGLLARIWELRDSVTACDATYVALAEGLGCGLVTADARLARAPGPTCSSRSSDGDRSTVDVGSVGRPYDSGRQGLYNGVTNAIMALCQAFRSRTFQRRRTPSCASGPPRPVSRYRSICAAGSSTKHVPQPSKRSWTAQVEGPVARCRSPRPRRRCGTTVLVVDASVLAPALADDGPDGDAARARLRAQSLMAPELIDLETTSVIRRQSQAGHLDLRRAVLALTDLVEMPLRRASHLPLLERCWDLRENLTVYDAAYVALAEVLDVVLVTADARLAKAPGPRCEIELLAS